MKTCINGATTMPCSLEDDIESAGKAGLQGMQIWKDKLDRYLQDHRKRDLKDLISQYNLGISAICPFFGYIWCQQDDLERKIEETKRYFEIASYIRCESVLISAGARGDKTPIEVIEAHEARLRRLADIGEDYDVKAELEWFQDLADAIKIVELAAHEHLGIMIDTFHWYRGDGNLNHIDLVPGPRLFLVHINDCEDITRANLTDKNRLYCGEGVMPLIEILNWKKDPLTISKDSLATLKADMKQAKLIR